MSKQEPNAYTSDGFGSPANSLAAPEEGTPTLAIVRQDSEDTPNESPGRNHLFIHPLQFATSTPTASLNSPITSLEFLLYARNRHDPAANTMATSTRTMMMGSKRSCSDAENPIHQLDDLSPRPPRAINVLDRLILPPIAQQRLYPQPTGHAGNKMTRREHVLSVLERAMAVIDDGDEHDTQRNCRQRSVQRHHNCQSQFTEQ